MRQTLAAGRHRAAQNSACRPDLIARGGAGGRCCSNIVTQAVTHRYTPLHRGPLLLEHLLKSKFQIADPSPVARQLLTNLANGAAAGTAAPTPAQLVEGLRSQLQVQQSPALAHSGAPAAGSGALPSQAEADGLQLMQMMLNAGLLGNGTNARPSP